MNLPQHFLDEMKTLLGEDYEAWLSSYEQTPHQGLRINRTKTTAEHWSEISPFEGCEPVAWTDNGFYYPDELRPARHPYYFAGRLFHIILNRFTLLLFRNLLVDIGVIQLVKVCILANLVIKRNYH